MSQIVLSCILLMNILLRPAFSFVARSSSRAPQLVLMASIHATSSIPVGASNGDDNLVLDPLVVCGPSGVGKGTIIEKYMKELGGKERFGFTVSHTTRAPRPGEEHGIHYHYTTLDEMRKAIDDGHFLEHAEVHGNLYGTSWESMKAVQRSGKHCLLDIDVQGVQRLKTLENARLKPRYVFIAPPSLEVLLQRLKDRGTESEESLERRTQNAKAEVEYGLAPGNFDYVVVNSDLDKACQDFFDAVNDAYANNGDCPER